jgi:glycosyltransferase involved in cell wall biosynthesis
MGVEFSVVLIVKNEANTLPRLLNSLSYFTGDVVVVDTGSTDGTPDVAEDYKCNVIRAGNQFVETIQSADEVNERFIVAPDTPLLRNGETYFNFGKARNFADGFAEHDTILSLDADETVTHLETERISGFIQGGYTRFDHLQVFTHDAMGNPDIEFLQSKFYNRKNFRWENRVHEMLAGEGKRMRLNPDSLTIEHWQNAESNRTGYARGLMLDCFYHPNADRQHHYFGRELLFAERFASAEKQFRYHLSLELPPQEYPTTPTHLDSWVYLGQVYAIQGRMEDELECYRRAHEIEPDNRRPIERTAQCYQWHGNKEMAKKFALEALGYPWKEEYGASKEHFYDIINDTLAWATL